METRKIAVDIRMWHHAGIGRYLRELVAELLSQTNSYEFIFLGGLSQKEDIRKICFDRKRKFSYRETRSKIYSLAEQWEIRQKAKGADLLHVPHFNVPVLCDKRLVVTIHDLIYLHRSESSLGFLGRSYLHFLLKRIEKKSAFILTVSEATKKELLEFFPKIPREKICVTHESCSPIFKRAESLAVFSETKAKFSLTKPFVLFVGSLKIHKNIPTLIRAIKALREKNGLDHELVLVGREDLKNKDLLRLIRANPFVRPLGALSDPELLGLYHLADTMVLPSFREGFGLPVLEAMACGTPVIASNQSSLPEVVGDAGLLFDPSQVDELVTVLYNVLSSKELRDKMSKNGLNRAKLFSWEKTARETLEVYQKALQTR